MLKTNISTKIDSYLINMGRFCERIFYAARYYIFNEKWIFAVNVIVCLGGAIFGAVTKINIFSSIQSDITVNVIITGGFGAVFWHCFFPNIIIIIGAFFLGFNSITVWLIFVITFFRGLYIGGFCVSVWCLGFYGVIFILFYSVIQIAFCAFVLGYVLAYSLDNCNCSFYNADYQILIFLAVFTAIFALFQCCIVFLLPRAILII